MGTRGYILLDGVSNVDKGIALESVVPFIIPKRSRTREPLPGRLSAPERLDWDYQPTAIKLGFIARCADKAAVVNAMQSAAAWLQAGSKLRLWYAPEKYYLGAVEGECEFSMLTRNHGRLSAEFLCNPPCWHRTLTKQAGWEPLPGTPVPEQISAATETASVSLTAPGSLPLIGYASAFPAALYLAVTGTWDTLNLGGAQGLVLNWKTPQAMTVYVDCEAQQVYHRLGGVMTSLMGYCSGDFPALTATSAIAIAGQNIDVTVRLLAIERG